MQYMYLSISILEFEKIFCIPYYLPCENFYDINLEISNASTFAHEDPLVVVLIILVIAVED